jgi:hypothetical protein
MGLVSRSLVLRSGFIFRRIVGEVSDEKGERPKPAGKPGGKPLSVTVEWVFVDGPDGEYLRRRQEEAIRHVLQWLVDHLESAEGGDARGTEC